MCPIVLTQHSIRYAYVLWKTHVQRFTVFLLHLQKTSLKLVKTDLYIEERCRPKAYFDKLNMERSLDEMKEKLYQKAT